jgi:hypothetical protein
LDSPLTFLGFQTNQAAAVAVQPYLPDKTRLFLAASHLGRSQHTALQFLRQWSLPCPDLVPTALQTQVEIFDVFSIQRLRRFLDATWRSDLKPFARDRFKSEAKRYQFLVEQFFDPAQLKWVEEFLQQSLPACDDLSHLGPRLVQKPLNYTQHDHVFSWTSGHLPFPRQGFEHELQV